MPVRAWQRWRRRAHPTPTIAYICETTSLTLAMILLLSRRGIALASVGLAPVPIWAFATHVLIGTIAILSPDMISVLLRRLSPPAPLGPSELKRFDSIPRGKALISFIPVCIVGAFWENLCFRGVALHFSPPSSAGMTVMVLVSSGIFGLHHFRQGPLSVLFASLFGVVLCVLYLSTADLLSVMVAQALGNLAVCIYFAPKARHLIEPRGRPAPGGLSGQYSARKLR